MNKKMPEFWKTWNSKFRKNASKQVIINGHTDDLGIANEFACHFSQVYYQSTDDVAGREAFVCDRNKHSSSQASSDSAVLSSLSVELIDQCLSKLKMGKAPGPDDMSTEHLRYAHPLLIMHLKSLFRLILKHSYVPEMFGSGVSIPLLKDKSGSVHDMDNYRAITLLPVISKVFEMVLLAVCEPVLESDPLQFGFKHNTGCNDAIFSLKSVTRYFNERGSSVFIASLDIKKAFDRVNHYKLFRSLLSIGVPLIVVDVLSNWYSKMFCVVKWNGSLSRQFMVGSGVRQGSCLSPTIFNVFMNAFIVNLRRSDIGCHILNMYYGCLLYADDIVLLSPSVKGLQLMLDTCFQTACELSLQFNCSKSHCMVVGRAAAVKLQSMLLGDTHLHWSQSVKYLGVYIVSGKTLSFDVSSMKRAFYAACNSIFANADGLGEMALLALQEAYSLSVLMYAAPALHLNVKQTTELNVCWNMVFRKIFQYNKWESVRAVIDACGRIDVRHQILVRKIQFYRRIFYTNNCVLHKLFCALLSSKCIFDSCMISIFNREAVQNVYDDTDCKRLVPTFSQFFVEKVNRIRGNITSALQSLPRRQFATRPHVGPALSSFQTKSIQ